MDLPLVDFDELGEAAVAFAAEVAGFFEIVRLFAVAHAVVDHNPPPDERGVRARPRGFDYAGDIRRLARAEREIGEPPQAASSARAPGGGRRPVVAAVALCEYHAVRVLISVLLTPQAPTRIKTSPSPGTGFG